MAFVFWFCVGVILYVYFGYPMLLASGFLGRRRSFLKKACEPLISIIVPARNEEKNIVAKLDNLLSLDYPHGRLEILVGNDASTDRTSSLVRCFESPRVFLVDSVVRQGKSTMQNALVARSKGDILVFTDADCLFPLDSLRRLVENMADPSVALVTNSPVFTNPHESGVVMNESLYWRYEKWLRRQESDRGLLTMASGSLFAMRRNHWHPLDPDLGDDFVLPLRVVRAGYRNVLETRTAARTFLGQNQPLSMLGMKMRIIHKDFRGLLRFRDRLNPLKAGRIAVALFSHKLLRWAVPYFMMSVFVTNLFLLDDPVYASLFWGQVLFYALAGAGFMLESRHIRSPLSILSSLCLVNFAALLGTLGCFSRGNAGQWETVR